MYVRLEVYVCMYDLTVWLAAMRRMTMRRAASKKRMKTLTATQIATIVTMTAVLHIHTYIHTYLLTYLAGPNLLNL